MVWNAQARTSSSCVGAYSLASGTRTLATGGTSSSWVTASCRARRHIKFMCGGLTLRTSLLVQVWAGGKRARETGGLFFVLWALSHNVTNE